MADLPGSNDKKRPAAGLSPTAGLIIRRLDTNYETTRLPILEVEPEPELEHARRDDLLDAAEVRRSRPHGPPRTPPATRSLRVMTP